jgi:hypothetical protein
MPWRSRYGYFAASSPIHPAMPKGVYTRRARASESQQVAVIEPDLTETFRAPPYDTPAPLAPIVSQSLRLPPEHLPLLPDSVFALARRGLGLSSISIKCGKPSGHLAKLIGTEEGKEFRDAYQAGQADLTMRAGEALSDLIDQRNPAAVLMVARARLAGMTQPKEVKISVQNGAPVSLSSHILDLQAEHAALLFSEDEEGEIVDAEWSEVTSESQQPQEPEKALKDAQAEAELNEMLS